MPASVTKRQQQQRVSIASPSDLAGAGRDDDDGSNNNQNNNNNANGLIGVVGTEEGIENRIIGGAVETNENKVLSGSTALATSTTTTTATMIGAGVSNNNNNENFNAEEGTFRPSAIVRVSSFQSIESVDSDSVSTPRNIVTKNQTNNNNTTVPTTNGGSAGLPEQIPNSSLNLPPTSPKDGQQHHHHHPTSYHQSRKYSQQHHYTPRSNKSHSISSSVSNPFARQSSSILYDTITQPPALMMMNMSPTFAATKVIMSKIFAGSASSSSSNNNNPKTRNQSIASITGSDTSSSNTANNNNNNNNNNDNSGSGNTTTTDLRDKSSPFTNSTSYNEKHSSRPNSSAIPLTTLATISEDQQHRLEDAVRAIKSDLVPELVTELKRAFGEIFDESAMSPEISLQLKNRIGDVIQLIAVSNTDVTIESSPSQTTSPTKKTEKEETSENGNNQNDFASTNDNKNNEKTPSSSKNTSSKASQLALLGKQLIEDIITQVSTAETQKVATASNLPDQLLYFYRNNNNNSSATTTSGRETGAASPELPHFSRHHQQHSQNNSASSQKFGSLNGTMIMNMTSMFASNTHGNSFSNNNNGHQQQQVANSTSPPPIPRQETMVKLKSINPAGGNPTAAAGGGMILQIEGVDHEDEDENDSTSEDHRSRSASMKSSSGNELNHHRHGQHKNNNNNNANENSIDTLGNISVTHSTTSGAGFSPQNRNNNNHNNTSHNTTIAFDGLKQETSNGAFSNSTSQLCPNTDETHHNPQSGAVSPHTSLTNENGVTMPSPPKAPNTSRPHRHHPRGNEDINNNDNDNDISNHHPSTSRGLAVGGPPPISLQSNNPRNNNNQSSNSNRMPKNLSSTSMDEQQNRSPSSGGIIHHGGPTPVFIETKATEEVNSNTNKGNPMNIPGVPHEESPKSTLSALHPSFNTASSTNSSNQQQQQQLASGAASSNGGGLHSNNSSYYNKRQASTGSINSVPSQGDLRALQRGMSNPNLDPFNQTQQMSLSLRENNNSNSNGNHNTNSNNHNVTGGGMIRNLSNMTIAGREYSSFLSQTVNINNNNNDDNNNNNENNIPTIRQLQQHIHHLEQQLMATTDIANFWKAQFGHLTDTMLNAVLRVERVSSNQQAKAASIFKNISRERQFFREQQQLLLHQEQQLFQQLQHGGGTISPSSNNSKSNRTPPRGRNNSNNSKSDDTNSENNPLHQHRSSVSSVNSNPTSPMIPASASNHSINNSKPIVAAGIKHSQAPRVSMVRFDISHTSSAGGDDDDVVAGGSSSNPPINLQPYTSTANLSVTNAAMKRLGSAAFSGGGNNSNFLSAKSGGGLNQVPSMRIGAVPQNIPDSHKRFQKRLSMARAQSLSAQRIYSAMGNRTENHDTPEAVDSSGGTPNTTNINNNHNGSMMSDGAGSPTTFISSPNAMTLKPNFGGGASTTGGGLIQFFGVGDGSGDGVDSPVGNVGNLSTTNSYSNKHHHESGSGGGMLKNTQVYYTSMSMGKMSQANASTASDISVQSYAPGQLMQVIESNVFAGASTTENILDALDDGGNGNNYDAGDMPIINHYQVLDKLGKGAQAPVFLAVDNDSMEPVAIKIVHRPVIDPRLMDSPLMAGKRRIVTAVRREVAAMKRCRHPNLVHLLEVIDDSSIDHMFLVIEYMGGGTAQLPRLATDTITGAKIADGSFNRRYSAKRVIQFGRRLCAALQYLHERRVVHRDLKPENILLRETGEPCIADFGIAELNENVKTAKENDAKHIRRHSLTAPTTRHPLFENSTDLPPGNNSASGSGSAGGENNNKTNNKSSLLYETAAAGGSGPTDESALLPNGSTTNHVIASESANNDNNNNEDEEDEDENPSSGFSSLTKGGSNKSSHHSRNQNGDSPSFQGTIAFLPPEDLQKMYHVNVKHRRSPKSTDNDHHPFNNQDASVTSLTFESHLSAIEKKFAGDVWALGLTLYCLVTGKLPFPATSMQDYAEHIVCEDIPFPPQGSKGWTSKEYREEFLDKYPEVFEEEPPLAEMDQGVVEGCEMEILPPNPDGTPQHQPSSVCADLMFLLKRMLTKDPETRIDVEACRIAFKKLDLKYNADLMV